MECNPDFRLYLHTSTPIHEIPAELAKDVLLVDFDQTRADVEDILLDVFTKQEKSRISDELRLLGQVGVKLSSLSSSLLFLGWITSLYFYFYDDIQFTLDLLIYLLNYFSEWMNEF